MSLERPARRWWELLIVAAAIGIFIWLGLGARSQPPAINGAWMTLLLIATMAALLVSGIMLWRRTRFS